MPATLAFTKVPNHFPTDKEVWQASDGQQNYFTVKEADGWKSMSVSLTAKGVNPTVIGTKFATTLDAQAACQLAAAATVQQTKL